MTDSLPDHLDLIRQALERLRQSMPPDVRGSAATVDAFADVVAGLDQVRAAGHHHPDHASAAGGEPGLQAILDTAVDAIITIDDRGIIESVNRATARLFGYEPDELIGRNVSMLMPEPWRGEHDGYIRRYHETGEKRIIGIGREVEGQRKDGSVFPIDLAVSEFRLGDRQLYTGMIRDITDRKWAAEELRQYAADLERSNKELEHFASIASHDLQEPLRKIRAFGDRLLEGHAGQIDERGRDYLRRMRSAAERMQTLIDDVLSYSRVTSRGQPFHRVDLNAVAQTVLSDLELRIQETGATVEVGTLPTIEADRAQMHQMLQNLIANALKFRRPDVPPHVRVVAELHTPRAGDRHRSPRWTIRVADNGIGFDERYLDRIFAVFQRLHPQHDYPGSGIGLAVVRKIVERHGGTISASSRPGEGAMFAVELPERQMHDPRRPAGDGRSADTAPH